MLAESGRYSLTTIQSLARHGHIRPALAYIRPIDEPRHLRQRSRADQMAGVDELAEIPPPGLLPRRAHGRRAGMARQVMPPASRQRTASTICRWRQLFGCPPRPSVAAQPAADRRGAPLLRHVEVRWSPCSDQRGAADVGCVRSRTRRGPDRNTRRTWFDSAVCAHVLNLRACGQRREAARFSDPSERDPGRAAGTLATRPLDVVAITLFSPDSWRGAVSMSCPEQNDPRLPSSGADQRWSSTRAIARDSGTPSISRLVIVAARAPRVPSDRSLSAMANTTP